MKEHADLSALVSRYASFFGKRQSGKLLIHVQQEPRSQTRQGLLAGLDLRRYDFEKGLPEYLRDVCAAARKKWQEEIQVDDDRIPMLSVRFGIAELSAFASDRAAVTFGRDTSWTRPLLSRWDDLSRLMQERRGPWFERVMESLRYLVRTNDGRFGVAVRGTMAPLDLAHALRGNELLAELYMEPQRVHELLCYCVRIGTEFMEAQLEAVGTQRGGTCSLFGVWLPGQAIGHMSNDAAALCSPDMYHEFGFPYDQQLIGHFSGALFHTHTLGLHLLPKLARLAGLSVIQIEDDPNRPSAASRLQYLVDEARGTPMMIQILPSQIRENIGLLMQGQFILQTRVKDEAAARDVVEFVRAHSRSD